MQPSPRLISGSGWPRSSGAIGPRGDGYKAGNIWDFCKRWGASHEFAITLDADSFMTGESILRYVRIMQVEPRLGILQSLVIGMPSTSAFARVFQFGMRLGMRSYTVGSAWWQADCGPYWGHNALIRVGPFREHGRLDALPDGSAILSHDQVEAVRLHAAGWAVWCVPEEAGSLEGNPPTLPEFLARDLRWAEGNMQYLPLLRAGAGGLMARWQLVQAVLLFALAPLWALAFLLAVLWWQKSLPSLRAGFAGARALGLNGLSAALLTVTSASTNTGSGLPCPNGAARPIMSTNSMLTPAGCITASTA